MDIGLREWLIVIGLIVIGGILFDGWRRMRGGKGRLKFKLDRSFSNLPDDDGEPEVLGPPRVVEPREPALDERELPSMTARDGGRRRHSEPRQGDLKLDAAEPVPTLLNALDGVSEEDDEEPDFEQESGAGGGLDRPSSRRR